MRSPCHLRIESPICPCCGTSFRARARRLVHLGDKRCPRCADFVVQHRAILPADKVAQLDDKDHDERLTGRRSGHTQVLAKPPAINAKGRVAGHLA